MRTLALLCLNILLLGHSMDAQTTLAEELEAKSQYYADNAPKEVLEAFAQGIEDVRSLGLVENAKNVGDAAPDGVLESAEGGQVRLSEQWAEGPVVLVFYRGGWCPYCNLQLRALERSLKQIEGAGARLVAVAPEKPERVAETAANNELSFLALSDPDNSLARSFGIVFTLPDVIRPLYEQMIGLSSYNGNDKDELPLAATYVIDQRGVIRWVFLEANYKKRAEPSEVVAAVSALGGE